MTIDEAITILGNLLKRYDFIDDKNVHKATQLGIEALERVRDMRLSPCTTADEILPGET